MPYAVESLFEVYKIDADFLVVFYAFSSMCHIVNCASSWPEPDCTSQSAFSTHSFILFCIKLVKTFPRMICRLMPL